jgi:hypothetical protein
MYCLEERDLAVGPSQENFFEWVIRVMRQRQDVSEEGEVIGLLSSPEEVNFDKAKGGRE